MEGNILFRERQKFNQWWLWFILFAVNGISIFSVCHKLIAEEQFGRKPGDLALLLLTFIVLAFTVLFISCRLETTIREDGIYVRFFPFHLRVKHYHWESMTKLYVRRYAPLAEYGGWGLRFGISGKGTAFNVSGDKGLQIEFPNRTGLLIGTRKPDELRDILNKLGRIKC